MAKKKHSPFGFGFQWDDEFEQMREEMERLMEDALKGFAEFPEEFERGAREKPYVYGFSLRVGPEGKPIIRKFGNVPKVSEKGVTEEREPLVDVIEDKHAIKVIAELPGASKEEIDLKTTPEKIEIKVDAKGRKYYKSVPLPARVKPLTAKASFKNGVLEVVAERESPRKEEPPRGHKVKVD